MKERESYYVSRKNPLTWIAALLMVGSVGLRIAMFCGKGTDSTTMWWLCVLPVVASLIFVLLMLLDGKEHFYRTLVPLTLMAVYFVAMLVLRGMPKRYIFLNGLVFLAFLIFYKQITAGHVNRPWLLQLMFLGALLVEIYDGRSALTAGQLKLWLTYLPDVAVLLGGLLVTFTLRPHTDGKYHPTWGDRSDGRRVRTLPPISVATPYLMVHRNEANNFIRDEIEISDLERYVREKRREGLTSFSITHVFIAAYVRCVAKYPAVNRFLSGQRVYSRGDDIQFCMVVKKEMTLEAPDTAIKLHLSPSDTVYDVYRKMEAAVKEVKKEELDSSFDQTAYVLTLLPGLLFKFAVWLLKLLDYFGLLPKFLLEVSPFHGSVFFTSMGSLGIPAIVHHLYDFGNLPAFVAFGCKYRRNEIANDGTVLQKKFMDITYNLDERICDGYYYAAVLKYMRRLLADPARLDVAPETVVQDIP